MITKEKMLWSFIKFFLKIYRAQFIADLYVDIGV